MRLWSTLRGQVTVLVVGVAAVATVMSLWAAHYNAEQAILEQASADGTLVGSIIAETVALSREIPDQLEEGLERDMASTARLLAEYVALAERHKVPREAILNAFERFVSDLKVADEIWITDATGRVVYSVPRDVAFVFTPDSKAQPQAAAFWPLMTGQAKIVSQPIRLRDLDGLPFKYVGVAGVDGPRIVQLGVRQDDVVALRERLSLQRLSDALMLQGVLKRPLLVVDDQLRPLRAGDGDQPSQFNPDPSRAALRSSLAPRDLDGLQQALESGSPVLRLEPDAAMIYRTYQTADGKHRGVFAADFGRESIDDLLVREQRLAMGVGLVTVLVASMLGWMVSRRYTERLSRITSVAGSVRQGDFYRLDDLKADLKHQDEVGVLGQVVHQMGLEVRNREAILEGQVRQRTQELSDRNQALAEVQAAISSELDLARRLQLGILPPAFPQRTGWNGAARVLMQQQMGGDFYDFIEQPDGKVAIVIADVSGKGITAAFFMAMARTSLLHHLSRGLRAHESLALANNELCRANPLDLFVTVFVAVLEPASGMVEYSNAGHNPPLHRHADGALHALDSPGDLALGVMPGYDYGQGEMQLQPGDYLLAYTDGVTEAFDVNHRDFSLGRLINWWGARPVVESPEQVVHGLFDEVLSFQGAAPQADDITVAVIRREIPQTRVNDQALQKSAE